MTATLHRYFLLHTRLASLLVVVSTLHHSDLSMDFVPRCPTYRYVGTVAGSHRD